MSNSVITQPAVIGAGPVGRAVVDCLVLFARRGQRADPVAAAKLAAPVAKARGFVPFARNARRFLAHLAD